MKYRNTLLLGLMLFVLQSVYAQKQATQAVYGEILGNGLTISANYDVRFSSKIDSWGARAGVGYFGDGKEYLFSVPVLINRLIGKDGNYLELGLGGTFVTSNSNFLNIKDGAVTGMASIMYRRQPIDGGFMWKIGFTPFISGGGITPYWAGVALGYAF